MARSTRSPKLETRSARLKLPIAKKPVFVKLAPGLHLGYRRNQTAGTWMVRRIEDGKDWTSRIADADDFEAADGNAILDWWQAQEKARTLARPERVMENAAKPLTVDQALAAYKADLRTRGADTGNVSRLLGHIPAAMRGKAVALLTARELRQWRDGLATTLAPSSVNRTCTAWKAALNLAAAHDERIVNSRAWETGLATIPDAEQSRNVILSDATVRGIIAAARAQSAEFGVLIEVAAVTGARVSQLARIEVQDLQADGDAPRLLMPTSKKGKGQKVVQRRPVPLPAGLALKLRALSAGRAATARLLVKPSGEPWMKSDHSRLFRRAAKAAGEDPNVVTMYALRHSSKCIGNLEQNDRVPRSTVDRDTSRADDFRTRGGPWMIKRTQSLSVSQHGEALRLVRRVGLSRSRPHHRLPPRFRDQAGAL